MQEPNSKNRFTQQVQENSQEIAALDEFLAAQPESIRRAIEVVSIPHWFTKDTLRELLDEDQRDSFSDWFVKLRELPIVEVFPDQDALRLNQLFRLALRQRLATCSRRRFDELSRRAIEAFSQISTQDQIEQIFHILMVDPRSASSRLRELEYDLRSTPKDRNALAHMLQETNDSTWPTIARGWGLLYVGIIRQEYVPIHETVAFVENAITEFLHANELLALALGRQFLADCLLARGQIGDAERAFQQYELSHHTIRQIYESNSNSLQAAQDLSTSLGRLGDYFLAHGQPEDIARAKELIDTALQMDKVHYEANPDSPRTARQLAISLNRLGEFYMNRDQENDFELALEKFVMSHQVLQRLHHANPNSLLAARDLSVSSATLGKTYLSRNQAGDFEQAFKHFEWSLDLGKQFYDADPNSSIARSSLCFALEGLGDVYLSRGLTEDAQHALELFEQSLPIRERQCQLNPDNLEAIHEMTESHIKLGDSYLSRGSPGDHQRALEEFELCFCIRQRQYQADPNSERVIGDLTTSLVKRLQAIQRLEIRDTNWLDEFADFLRKFHRRGRLPLNPRLRKFMFLLGYYEEWMK